MKKDTEKKSNLKIALDELLKGNLKTSPPAEELSDLKVVPESPIINVKKDEMELKKPYIPDKIEANVKMKANVKIEATVISEDTIIEGSIKSRGDLIIRGKVYGDVENEKGISISGYVEGNVKGNNEVSLEGSINGNFTSPSLLTITKESKIVGDVNCQRLESDGSITGNITASETVYIGSNSIVIGNIIAKSLSVKEGAKISGLFEISNSK